MDNTFVVTRYACSHTEIEDRLNSAIREGKSRKNPYKQVEYLSHNVCPIPNPSSNYNREFVITVVFKETYL